MALLPFDIKTQNQNNRGFKKEGKSERKRVEKDGFKCLVKKDGFKCIKANLSRWPFFPSAPITVNNLLGSINNCTNNNETLLNQLL